MRVEITSLRGTNRQSGLEFDRHYAVHRGPGTEGAVLVFDDNTDSFRSLTSAECEEVPDPLEPHDLLRIDRTPEGYRAVCLCVWRPCHPDSDSDEAVRTHRLHLSKMASTATTSRRRFTRGFSSGSTTCENSGGAGSQNDERADDPGDRFLPLLGRP
jgi:hypothetical protein